jgi:hypothetical protein
MFEELKQAAGTLGGRIYTLKKNFYLLVLVGGVGLAAFEGWLGPSRLSAREAIGLVVVVLAIAALALNFEVLINRAAASAEEAATLHRVQLSALNAAHQEVVHAMSAHAHASTEPLVTLLRKNSKLLYLQRSASAIEAALMELALRRQRVMDEVAIRNPGDIRQAPETHLGFSHPEMMLFSALQAAGVPDHPPSPLPDYSAGPAAPNEEKVHEMHRAMFRAWVNKDAAAWVKGREALSGLHEQVRALAHELTTG